jgi:DNA primase
MPIAWEELDAKLRPSRFTLRSVPGILARRGADPWASMGSLRQSITAAALRGLGAD